MGEAPTVLIVDDEMLIGMALADELNSHGFCVKGPFGTTATAQTASEGDLPDIAFLDVNLGKGRTSHAFANWLLDQDVPVVFLTGYSKLPPSDPKFRKLPVLSKPVSITKLIETIDSTLGKRPA
ncbi:response regulator [Erythrobacter sp.]|uniref:response regulator n=1 Tax=Erythrobacter sp. TaxID=1042 RepID=UPI002E98FBA5|nr:response regulator [Erythrobacter sp.]